MSERRQRTRRDEQRERTRSELIRAAAEVFSSHGFHGASVDDVAEAAGYTKGAVYSNFESKEELFLAVLEQQVDHTVDTLQAIVDETAPEERARDAAGWHDQLPLLDPSWFLLEAEFLLYAARHEDPSVRDRVAARQQRTRARIAELVEQHLRELGVDQPAVAAEDVARLLMATADGLAQAALVDASARDGNRLFAVLVTLLQDAARGGR